ncbi:hypothetical protein JTE90_028376 [Oedothorax gibbosus]|nr:hypothetical protein JTE90_028376 [Oedothorax gibbosus]
MDALNEVCPFVELVGTKSVEELKEPRVYMHHCPYNMVKKNPKAKYIYIYRNPEDVFVSYFHFLQERRGRSLDFELYFEGFLSGNIGYGRCFEHVLSYWQHKDEDDLLLVSYEKLLINRKEEILKIIKFLGESFHQAILSDESALEKIIEHTSFDYMKRNLTMFNSNLSKNDGHSEREVSQINFFRKGVIGEGKRSLSRDQLKRLRKVMEDVLEGTTLLEEWAIS